MKSFYWTHFWKNKNKDYIEIELPAWFGWNNPNSCLFHFYMTYGTSNGYTNVFAFNILSPFSFAPWHRSFHNGHARFATNLILFGFQFDWLDKKSIINVS